jgi:hypothetical protein
MEQEGEQKEEKEEEEEEVIEEKTPLLFSLAPAQRVSSPTLHDSLMCCTWWFSCS